VFEACARAGAGDSTKIALMLTLKEQGVVGVRFSVPQAKFGLCLTKLTGRTLSAPTSVPFTFKMDIDPAESMAASASKTPVGRWPKSPRRMRKSQFVV
jgi:hypothetical protein